MTRLFGTDGVRGVANRDLTARLAMELSVAAARVLAEAGVFEGHRPTAVVGRDPRASGEFLEAAVVAGLAGAGVDVLRVGVVPTPAVAFLTHDLDADLGVMLSASHNPAPDNGIKFFDRSGFKLADEMEDGIEAAIGTDWDPPTGAAVGRVRDDFEAADRYVAHVLASLPATLEGLRVVVDCAHGADVGIAHDGDADRCLAVTASGEVVDGDQIMAILALELRESGRLRADTIVATVMSNLGFKLAMRDAGIKVVETAVGDRYVLEAMKQGGYGFGGEQSGHVIMLDHATTGDGMLTGLHLLAAMARRGRPLDELAKIMTRLPQVLINVRGVDKAKAKVSPELASAVREAEAELGETGRVLIRPSGTEPMVRVMVEAAAEDQAHAIAERLAEVVRTKL